MTRHRYRGPRFSLRGRLGCLGCSMPILGAMALIIAIIFVII